ncbi:MULTISPECIES: YolD-like family protein [unclassified Bacillus (in: firmicutes)]|uniref:YolD-like family protein n=1 Tax=unclassified Bacillus (in: firmicutes) TaxID=185979 RepID=UPI000BF886FF|nr:MULTISPECIES: YolD-like family protein [unclassified Bacillus (in: firmicutes)]PEU18958.1 hypothetical protein CN525_09125 [Bacillus sp. AFS014408]PFW59447.1 hypothetical protein COL20_24365 [Bacillus sp. AFS075034]
MKETRIPRGRGKEKWNGFISMPEQFAGLHRMIHEQTKVPKPILDEQQKEEIERVLHNAYRTQEEVDLWYYKDGFIFHEIMDIQKIDPYAQIVIATDAFRFKNQFQFTDIVDCKIHN